MIDAPHRYREVWYVKRTSNSEPEQIVLFFKEKLFADVLHYKALKNNDARLLFGNEFPKEIASCWQ